MTQKLTPGHYHTRSLCDHDCIFRVEILKRTPKTVTIVESRRKNTTKRCKIHTYEGREYIYPYGQYSMCATIYADDRTKV